MRPGIACTQEGTHGSAEQTIFQEYREVPGFRFLAGKEKIGSGSGPESHGKSPASLIAAVEGVGFERKPEGQVELDRGASGPSALRVG